jgi:AcrR family transcriptional regulator
MGATRDNILSNALDLFVERGYEATSLREIAERLGITKAALYYHFRSKEELLAELMKPMAQVEALFLELSSRDVPLDAWADALVRLTDWLLAEQKLFQLIERNQAAFHSLGEKHEEMHRRLDSLLSDARVPLDQRVRLACAIGAITGLLTFGAPLVASATAEHLKPQIQTIVRSILGLKARAAVGK